MNLEGIMLTKFSKSEKNKILLRSQLSIGLKNIPPNSQKRNQICGYQRWEVRRRGIGGSGQNVQISGYKIITTVIKLLYDI